MKIEEEGNLVLYWFRDGLSLADICIRLGLAT